MPPMKQFGLTGIHPKVSSQTTAKGTPVLEYKNKAGVTRYLCHRKNRDIKYPAGLEPSAIDGFWGCWLCKNIQSADEQAKRKGHPGDPKLIGALNPTVAVTGGMYDTLPEPKLEAHHFCDDYQPPPGRARVRKRKEPPSESAANTSADKCSPPRKSARIQIQKAQGENTAAKEEAHKEATAKKQQVVEDTAPQIKPKKQPRQPSPPTVSQSQDAKYSKKFRDQEEELSKLRVRCKFLEGDVKELRADVKQLKQQVNGPQQLSEDRNEANPSRNTTSPTESDSSESDSKTNDDRSLSRSSITSSHSSPSMSHTHDMKDGALSPSSKAKEGTGLLDTGNVVSPSPLPVECSSKRPASPEGVVSSVVEKIIVDVVSQSPSPTETVNHPQTPLTETPGSPLLRPASFSPVSSAGSPPPQAHVYIQEESQSQSSPGSSDYAALKTNFTPPPIAVVAVEKPEGEPPTSPQLSGGRSPVSDVAVTSDATAIPAPSSVDGDKPAVASPSTPPPNTTAKDNKHQQSSPQASNGSPPEAVLEPPADGDGITVAADGQPEDSVAPLLHDTAKEAGKSAPTGQMGPVQTEQTDQPLQLSASGLPEHDAGRPATSPSDIDNSFVEEEGREETKPPDYSLKYKEIMSCTGITNVQIEPDSGDDTCKCDSSKGDVCGEDCLNRATKTECLLSGCPTGDSCTNQQIQKHLMCKDLETFETGTDRGRGVRTTAPVKKGTFLCEYVGEILSADKFNQRMNSCYKTSPHHYALRLNASFVIDAYKQGNISRFINHSCDPNCETQKWHVSRLLRVGIFALRDLDAGEEVTYDYNFHSFEQGQRCLCNAPHCQGTLRQRGADN